MQSLKKICQEMLKIERRNKVEMEGRQDTQHKGVRALRGYFGPFRVKNWKLPFTNFILLIY